jgi:hypothetical protein
LCKKEQNEQRILRKALELKLETDIWLDPEKMVQPDTGRHKEKWRQLAIN